MADKIVWTLGADASQVRAEMNSAMASVNKATRGMSDELNKTDGSQERVSRGQKSLLESNNRVTNQFAGFTRTLLSARNATDVVVSGLDRLENSLNLSLGAGIGLAAGAVIIEKVSAIRAEYKALRDEINSLYRAGSADFQSLTQLEDHLNRVTAALRKLETIQSNRGVWQSFKDYLSVGRGAAFSELNRERDISRLRGDESEDRQAIARKAQIRNDVRGSTRGATRDTALKMLDLDEQIRETGTPGSNKENQILSEQLRREKELLLKEYEAVRSDRTNLSLVDIAANSARAGTSHGQGWRGWLGTPQTGTIQAQHQGRQAREVLRLEEEARQKVLLYADHEGAQRSLTQADEIRNSIGGLKESEKDLKGAINASELPKLLTQIATNTGGMFKGR